MALFQMPTGILTEEIVETLPKEGEENKVYRRLIDPTDPMQFTEDFIWYDGEWHTFSFDAKIYGAFFQRYQESVEQTMAELAARIEELEGNNVLFVGNNISLTEGSATIGKTIIVVTDITLADGDELNITLENMTMDGEPIEDVSGTITIGSIPSWDWRGGELYSDTFGNSAYFSFGTKPIDGNVNQITLGLTNEQEHFDVRTLEIGHIKVEVV